jgi:hypothetical protein
MPWERRLISDLLGGQDIYAAASANPTAQSAKA